MSEAREAVAERARRRTRLAELGLDEEDLTISVVSSAAEAARWTPNHPKTARGLMRWIGLVAEERQAIAVRQRVAPGRAAAPTPSPRDREHDEHRASCGVDGEMPQSEEGLHPTV